MKYNNLDEIAGKLEAIEESIIFKLLARAQYKRNNQAYEKSFFDEMLLSIEEVFESCNRYEIIEEVPFSDVINLSYEKTVDLTENVKLAYFNLLDDLCETGEDPENYGSSTEHDIYALQAISERIHFGAYYVAWAKYNQDPEKYYKFIQEANYDALYDLLTRKDVEEKILKRVEEKVNLYQKGANPKYRKIINPKIIVDFYKESVIPLTKKGEVEHLINSANE
ncbi:MAG: chorismate mutase [Candidatus Gracilibacteria bacterium]|jgi:chorismate mutase|nr:chorismate mutase [Candidatus Gracilibacteria bacterium]